MVTLVTGTSAEGAVEMTWMDIKGDKLLPPLATLKDFMKSIATTRPSVNNDDVKKQGKWNAQERCVCS